MGKPTSHGTGDVKMRCACSFRREMSGNEDWEEILERWVGYVGHREKDSNAGL